MNLDLLVVGTHPDDAELGLGGLLCKLARRGKRVGILDLTRGELASRGSVSERSGESSEAARRLGVTVRENASLPDGGVLDTLEQRRVVISALRRLRPKVLIAPLAPDRHPDHTAAYELVRAANFLAGVHGIETGQPPYRADTVYYYHSYHESERLPELVIDISEEFDQKLEALRAYASQFYNPAYQAAPTWVSSEGFWDNLRTRAAHWGARVGVQYGEPLYVDRPMRFDVPPGLSGDSP